MKYRPRTKNMHAHIVPGIRPAPRPVNQRFCPLHHRCPRHDRPPTNVTRVSSCESLFPQAHNLYPWELRALRASFSPSRPLDGFMIATGDLWPSSSNFVDEITSIWQGFFVPFSGSFGKNNWGNIRIQPFILSFERTPKLCFATETSEPIAGLIRRPLHSLFLKLYS